MATTLAIIVTFASVQKKKKDTELSLQQVLAVGGLEPRLECTARVADVVPALWNWSCTSCHGRMAG